jgi:hypothetical protein
MCGLKTLTSKISVLVPVTLDGICILLILFWPIIFFSCPNFCRSIILSITSDIRTISSEVCVTLVFKFFLV